MTRKLTDKIALEAVVEKYLEIQEEIKELSQRAEELKDLIKETMGDQETLVVGGYTIHWSRYVTNRFDPSAFKIVHPKLYESFKVASESRRFSISEK